MKKNNENKISLIQKLCVFALILFMPLSTYTTPIPGITLGDVTLVLAIIATIIYGLRTNINLQKVLEPVMLAYIAFITVNSLLNWLIHPDEIISGLLSVVRYTLYMFFVLTIPKHFINKEFFYKWYKIFGIIFATYAIMQFVAFNIFNIVLPINVLGLEQVEYIDGLYSEDTLDYYTSGQVAFRAYSVFIEPAYFAIFQIGILFLVLNNKNENQTKKLIIGALITLGLVVTGSTTAIVLIPFCWLQIINVKKITFSKVLLVLIGIIIMIYVINLEVVQLMLDRIITSDGQVGSSIEGRFENYDILSEITDSPLSLLLGNGFWYETEYLPSYGRILVSFGMIGIVFYFVWFIHIYVKSNKIAKFFIFIMLLSLIGTNTLYNISSVLMFSLILMNQKEEKEV